jgi:hypothetical protein
MYVMVVQRGFREQAQVGGRLQGKKEAMLAAGFSSSVIHAVTEE